MNRGTFADWRIGEYGFPAGGSESEKLRYPIGYAILVPWSRNAQRALSSPSAGCLRLGHG